MAGKITLAKASLGSMPNHDIQYIQLPSKIHHHIDKTQRNFIWGTTDTKKKMYMVNGNHH